MSYNADAQVFETQIVVTNTTQPAGVTSGSIINKGSLSTYDTYVTGHTVINNVKITPNLNDIVYEQQATLNNNQNSWADITEFYFDDSVCNSFKALINVTVSAGSDKYAIWELNGLYKPTGWVITSSFSGDLTGVQFSIANKEGGIGQIQYQNSNTTGTTYIRYRAKTTAPPGSTPLGVSSGVINNTSGPFITNNLVYASNSNTLATTDLSYVSNVLTVGGSSRFVAEKSSSFVNFSNGGALTSMGDASVAKNLIIGQKIGVANTSPAFSLDVAGDINFTGTFYKNGNVYSGSEIWATNSSSVFYTAGNVGLGTSTPTHQLDVVGGIRSSAGLTTTTLVSTSVTSGSVSSTDLVGTNATIASGLFTNANVTTGTVGTLVSSNANVTTGTVGTLVSSNANVTTGTVGTLISTNANVTTGTVGTLVSSNANVTTGTVGTLVSSNANVTTATIGSFVAGSGTIGGHLVPSTNIVHDLGSSSLRWRDLYLSGNTIHLGEKQLSLTGDVFQMEKISITSSIDASSITSASLLVSGGAGISGKLRVGGTSHLTSIEATSSTITNMISSTASVTTGTVGTLVSSNANVSTGTVGTLLNTNAVSTNISSGTLNLSTGLTSASAQITNVVSTTISAGTLVGTTFTGGSMSLSGDLVIGGTLTTVNITTTNVVDTHITSGNINITSLATIVNANVTTMTAGNARVTNVTTGTLNVSSIISVSDTANAPAGAVTGSNVIFASGGMSYNHQIPPDEYNPNGSTESRPYYYSSDYFVTALPVDPTPGYNPYAYFYNPTAFKYTGSSSATINWRVQTPGANAPMFGTYTIYIDILDTNGTTILSTPATLVYSSGSLVTDTGVQTTTLNSNQYIRFRGDGGMGPSINNFVFTYDLQVNVNSLIANSSGVTVGSLKATTAQFTTLTAGSIRTSDIALSGNLVATGDITAFGNISDGRFKENIQSIESDFALGKVKSLRPVTFTWKSNIANTSKIGTDDAGFIAQEVEEVVEYAVGEFTDLESGEVYKKINHERIIPYLVGAIQKLEAKITELEGKL